MRTPVLPHHFLVSCRSSFMQFFHIFRIFLGSNNFFLNILVFVCTLSIFSREFIAWNQYA